MKKAFVSFLVLLFLVMFGSSAWPSAITMGFEPVSQTVDLGTQVSAALVISGLGNGTALGTFDVTVSFDPSILAYNNVIYGDPVLGDQLDLFGLGSITDATAAPGAVELFELSLDELNNQAPTFALVILTFDTLNAGTSPLNVTTLVLGDASGDSIAADKIDGSVDVHASAVPEPSILLLLASGLAALGLSGRKRTSAEQGVRYRQHVYDYGFLMNHRS